MGSGEAAFAEVVGMLSESVNRWLLELFSRPAPWFDAGEWSAFGYGVGFGSTVTVVVLAVLVWWLWRQS